MQTIYEATENGKVHLRYEGGVYEFDREQHGKTLPNAAGGVKVSGTGRDLIIRLWTDKLEKA